jgi:hypothetical protein
MTTFPEHKPDPTDTIEQTAINLSYHAGLIGSSVMNIDPIAAMTDALALNAELAVKLANLADMLAAMDAS